MMDQVKAISMREQKISHKASIMSKSAKKVKKKKNKNKKKGEIKFSQNANQTIYYIHILFLYCKYNDDLLRRSAVLGFEGKVHEIRTKN